MKYELLAKPNEYLRDHLLETLNIAEKITINYRLNNNIRKAALVSAAFHDLGKADTRIQNALIQEKRTRLSHALLTLGLVGNLLKELLPTPYDILTLISIASHHSPFTKTLFMGYDATAPQVREDRKSELKLIVQELLNRLGVKDIAPKIEEEIGLRVFYQAKDALPIAIAERKKLREEFILIQGVLIQSDWLASSMKKISPLYYPKHIVKTKKRRKDFDHYQRIASTVRGNLFITLPTGYGKTETALFWARANDGKRLYYVLPTRTTINAMRKRLQTIWNDSAGNTVGFYHSRAELYLVEDSSVNNYESVFDDLLIYKYFFTPINVTTPDQLILTLMNYKRYTLKSFPLMDSRLIFDEIHAYDEITLGLIKGLIRHLNEKYGTCFCIMSATFPRMIKEQFSFLKAKPLLSKDETQRIYRNIKRTKLKVNSYAIEKAIPSIIDDVKNGRRVLVVLNTVKKAQQFYQILRDRLIEKFGEQAENKIVLLHSRFTLLDRIKKEESLMTRKNLPQVLVATQVIEVSLDIDYDVLYTEACYPDALYQRAGRVNRRSTSTRPKPVYVFKPESYHPYKKELMDRAWNFICNYEDRIRSELDYLTMVEKFYQESFDIDEIEEGEERYDRIWNIDPIYSVDLLDENIQSLLKTRSGYINIPAYPKEFLNKLIEVEMKIKEASSKYDKWKFRIERMKMSVDVPLTYNTVNLLKKISQGYWIIEARYDPKLGLMIDAPELCETVL